MTTMTMQPSSELHRRPLLLLPLLLIEDDLGA